MKKRTIFGLLGLAAGAGAGAGILSGLGALGNRCYDLTLLPRSYSPQSCPEEPEDPVLLGRQWLWEHPRRRERTIRSVDGLHLHGWYIPSADPASQRWAICVHPYQDDSSAMGLYASRYAEAGYHVLLPDLRGYGQSEGDYVGMGWDDRLDLVAWLSLILRRHPQARVLLHGVSLGAAAALLAAGGPLPEQVKAVIADGAYTEAQAVLLRACRKYVGEGLPPAVLSSALRAAVRRRAGYDLRSAAPIRAVERCKVPVLFIHGSQDTFVPPAMMAALYEAAASPRKQFLWVPGAGHGQCAARQPELYWDTVELFLAEPMGKG